MLKYSFIMSVLIVLICSCTKTTKNSDLAAWKQKLIKTRLDKDKEFKVSSISPFAGHSRLTALKGSTNYLVFDSGSFKLEKSRSSGVLFSVSMQADKWVFSLNNSEFTCVSDGKQLQSGDILEQKVKGKYEKYTFVIYPLAETLVIVIFDPDHESIQEFEHLAYFPLDYDFRVEAEFNQLLNPEQIEMITSRNQVKIFYRYAKITFKVKGREQWLIAYKNDLGKEAEGAWIFIPFKDNTSGETTYGAGRFLELKEPIGDSIIIDFNKAFNPLCNYSYVYNCSYPPEENSLDMKIEAGEKTYLGDH
ncbi:DUF1684 domain-containing protein [bacterium]|nr:DUF1684 domain-containing protein [bacterium]